MKYNEASTLSIKDTGTSTTHQSSSIETGSTVRELTDADYGNITNIKKIEIICAPGYVTKVLPNSMCTTVGADLNFSVGRSADIARRLIHESDLREAREVNQKTSKKWKRSTTKVRKCKETNSNVKFQ